jgi:hypothetical protein
MDRMVGNLPRQGKSQAHSPEFERPDSRSACEDRKNDATGGPRAGHPSVGRAGLASSLRPVPRSVDDLGMSALARLSSLSSLLLSVLACSWLTACASAGMIEPASEPNGGPEVFGPVVAHGAGDGRYVALEARPSLAAAELLPSRAHYRVTVPADGSLALVIVGVDQRILGRLRIDAIVASHHSAGVRLELDDLTGRATRVEAWSSAGSLHGQVSVGERSARWRVRLEPDGRLEPERWPTKHRGPEAAAELLELRRAQAISADLFVLASQWTSPELADDLTELFTLAELALDLSHRAWSGTHRAKLSPVE